MGCSTRLGGGGTAGDVLRIPGTLTDPECCGTRTNFLFHRRLLNQAMQMQ